MKMLRAFVRAAWTICKKDVRVWLRQPANVAITVLPALALLAVSALSAGGVGRGPRALGRPAQSARGQHRAMPLLVLLLVVSGLVSSSLSAAGEWETRTIKELLLSPASSGAIITGKVLTGFVTTVALGVLVLGVGSLLGWVQPVGVYWLQVLLILALVALFSAGLGVALGALLQRFQSGGSAAIVLGPHLFFLTGGTAVLAFDPGGLQTVATFVPLYYGRHALEMAVFYQSSDHPPPDVVGLA